MKHASAIYCTCFLSFSVVCLAHHYLFYMYGTFVPLPPFLYIFLRLLHHTAAADMTVSRTVPPHHDAWPPASPLCAPPLRHDVTIAAALRLISPLLMVKDHTFHTVSGCVTFMLQIWQLHATSLEIHLVFLSIVWFTALEPDLCLWPPILDDPPHKPQ